MYLKNSTLTTDGVHPTRFISQLWFDYKFSWYEVGTKSAAYDFQIYKDCDFYDAFHDGRLNIPGDDTLPNDDTPQSYYILHLRQCFCNENLVDETAFKS